MDTQELFVHDRCQGQGTKGLHAGVINALRVLVLALELEGEVVGEMSTFMVSPEQEERVGVPYFEGPEIENALRRFVGHQE